MDYEQKARIYPVILLIFYNF